MSSKNKQWVVYMLICDDKSIYTGITNDLEKRISMHNKGKGAKYTRTRLPVKLAASWECEDKVQAAKMEYKYKKLIRAEKLKQIKMAIKTNAEKAVLYDQYLRESDALQAENSRLKSHNAGNISEEDQKTIDSNNIKINELVQKLQDLFNE